MREFKLYLHCRSIRGFKIYLHCRSIWGFKLYLHSISMIECKFFAVWAWETISSTLWEGATTECLTTERLTTKGLTTKRLTTGRLTTKQLSDWTTNATEQLMDRTTNLNNLCIFLKFYTYYVKILTNVIFSFYIMLTYDKNNVKIHWILKKPWVV